jgi:hypothetical protein
MFVMKKMVAAHVWTVMLVDNAVNVKLGTLVTLLAKNVNVCLDIQTKSYVIKLMEHAIVWKGSMELCVRFAVMNITDILHALIVTVIQKTQKMDLMFVIRQVVSVHVKKTFLD